MGRSKVCLMEADAEAPVAAEKLLDDVTSNTDSESELKSSTIGTALNMLNELEGSGLLGLPYGVRLIGWSAIGCMAVAGSMAGMTGYLIAGCMVDSDGARVRSSYPEVGKACYGARGEQFVALVQTSNLLCVGVVYLVLLGQTMNSVYSITDSVVISHFDQRSWTLIATVCVLPTVHLGGYGHLTLLSALGITCLTAIIVLGISCS